VVTPTRLETDRLFLRIPEAGDAASFAVALADPEVMRYIGSGETGTPNEEDVLVARMQHAWKLDGFGMFTVVRRDDQAVLGRVGLLVWDPKTWTAGTRAEIDGQVEIEIGWKLRRDAWGVGYATEAAGVVRDWAPLAVQPERLISLIQQGNVASMRVAEKLGERYERDVVTAGGVTVQLWTT
jgi:RimJ/RimL family protein N-acetyltransferase